ncbi:AaceriACR247WAp [[Ashbya] aceris (nom. inval.)]|nr:AaceriACR247WAp [[Ashbya] aceris (nom. inval.)]
MQVAGSKYETLRSAAASKPGVTKQRQSKNTLQRRLRSLSGRQPKRWHCESTPRQGVVIDESLAHLAMQQENNGFFYIIELSTPGTVPEDVPSPRYETEEPPAWGPGDQDARQDPARRLQQACSIVVEELPDQEDIEMSDAY